MEDVEFTLAEDDDVYVLVARCEPNGWHPDLFDASAGERVEIVPIPVYLLRQQAPYPTPGKCILALAEAVVSELCGVRV